MSRDFQASLPRMLANAILSAIAVLGTLLCVVSAFSLSINFMVLALVTLVASLLFSAGFLWKKVLWGVLGLAAVLLVAGVLTGLFSAVGPSLRQFGHDVLLRFSSAYPNLSFVVPAAPAVPVTGYTMLFCVAAILLSVWMAWGVGYRSCLISVAGTLPFLLLCVIINDTPPRVVPLIMLLSVWMTVLLARERTGEPASMDATRVGLTLMAVLLFLCVVGVLYPKDTSGELPQVVQDMLDHLPGPMQSMLSRDGDYHTDDLGADTSEILDLTEQGTRSRTDTVMMQISATETGVLYLRGAAKDVYTGTSWESRNEAGQADSIYAHTSLGSAFGSSSQAALEIRNYHDSATVAFTPYGFISGTGEGEVTSDLRIPCYEDDYVIYYWPGLSTLDLSSAAGETDESYDRYVEETCLQLPDDTREALRELALSYGYDEQLGTLETISWVVDFVRSAATYQLSVSRQPVNYDFAVYFLTESKAGYCVHFATATAVMLRALGIPARYASGYRVSVTEAGGVTDIIDRDTHAWAEVYLSGLGWIPIESTPGFGSSVALPDLEASQEPAENTEEPANEEETPEETPEEAQDEEEAEPEPEEAEPSPSPEEAEPSPEPEEQVPAEPDTDLSPSPGPEDSIGLGGEGEAGGGAARKLLWLLWIPAVLLAAVLAVLLRRRIVVVRRAGRFNSGSTNEQVIARWGYVEKLTAWGAEIPEDMEPLALKAKFSQHEITPEELASFSAEVTDLAKSVPAGLTGWKRFRFRYLSCL